MPATATHIKIAYISVLSIAPTPPLSAAPVHESSRRTAAAE